MALGRVLPRLVALRYCGEVSMGAGHMIYGGIVTWRGSRDIRRLSHDMFSIFPINPVCLGTMLPKKRAQQLLVSTSSHAWNV